MSKPLNKVTGKTPAQQRKERRASMKRAKSLKHKPVQGGRTSPR